VTRRTRLFIDLALLVGLLVANDPARTGLAVHEWLSIALMVPILVHLVINWEWTMRVTSKFFDRLFSVSRLNLVVDVALFASTVAVIVSGFAVSSVLPGLLGLASAATPLWIAVHATSASATIIALLVHFALHAKWFVQTVTAMLEGCDRPAVRPAPNPRTVPNTASVLMVALTLSAAIFLTVGGTGALLGLNNTATSTQTTVATAAGYTSSASNSYGTASSSSSTGLRTCPRTGCTASSCHAETGRSPYAN